VKIKPPQAGLSSSSALSSALSSAYLSALCSLLALSLALGEVSASPELTERREVEGVEAWLSELTEQALKGRRELLAAQAMVRASREALKASERWANPKVSYRYAPRPLETKRGETPHAFGLSQRLPAWGALDAERQLSAAQLSADEDKRDELALTITFEVQRALWRLWLAERSLELTEAREAWQARLAEELEGLISAGVRPLSELIRLDQRRALLRDQALRHKAEVRRARVTLGERLGRSPYLEPLSRNLRGLLPPTEALSGPKRSQVERLVAEPPRRPQLERALSELARAEAMSAQLTARQRPQVELGLQWVVVRDGTGVSPQGDDALIAQLGVSLPLWREADRAERRAASERVLAQRERAQRLSERWVAELQRLAHSLTELAVRAQAYETQLIPRQRRLLETLEGEVSVGSAPLARLYEASERLEELSLTLSSLVARYAEGRAGWERLTGEALLSSTQGPTLPAEEARHE